MELGVSSSKAGGGQVKTSDVHAGTEVWAAESHLTLAAVRQRYCFACPAFKAQKSVRAQTWMLPQQDLSKHIDGYKAPQTAAAPRHEHHAGGCSRQPAAAPVGGAG